MKSQKPVIIFDTTLRDWRTVARGQLEFGRKNGDCSALVLWALMLSEAGFPIVSAGDFEAVKEIAKAVRGVTVCGLARCKMRTLSAWEALKHAEHPVSTCFWQLARFIVMTSYIWVRTKSLPRLLQESLGQKVIALMWNFRQRTLRGPNRNFFASGWNCDWRRSDHCEHPRYSWLHNAIWNGPNYRHTAKVCAQHWSGGD